MSTRESRHEPGCGCGFGTPAGAHPDGCACRGCVLTRQRNRDGAARQAVQAAVGEKRARAAAFQRARDLEKAARELEAELCMMPGTMHHGVAVITPEGTIRSLDCNCTPCIQARKAALGSRVPVRPGGRRITWPPEPAAGPEAAGPSDRSGDPDPAAAVTGALAEFDAWLAGGPHYPPELNPERVPAGMCRECHLGPAVSSGRCFWCQLALDVKDANRGAEALTPAAESLPGHVTCSCRECARRGQLRRLYLVLAAWTVLALAWCTAMGIITWNLAW